MGEEIGQVVFNLSIGYIAAFIFYVLDVWIPESENKKKVNNRISIPMSRLLHRMHEPLKNISQRYGNLEDINQLSYEEIGEIAKYIDVRDDSPAINSNYGQYLYRQIKDANKFIEQIYKLPLDIDIEVIDLLDRIQNSTYHEIMKTTNSLSGMTKNFIRPETGKTALEEYIPEYLILYKELKECMISKKDNHNY